MKVKANISPKLLELASKNLQQHLDFTLIKMKWAFFCTIAGMFAGLMIIILGVYKVYQSPTNINACILTSVSALFIEFISATLFVIYKLTVMEVQKCLHMLQKMILAGCFILLSFVFAARSARPLPVIAPDPCIAVANPPALRHC
jgi:hypothetical protein